MQILVVSVLICFIVKVMNCLYFTYKLTYECNQNCSYCYLKGWSIPKLISGKQAGEWLLNFVNKFNFTKILVGISGGEPLLYKEDVLDFFYTIKQLSNKKITDEAFVLFTNGTLLDYAFYAKLDFVNFRIHIDKVYFSSVEPYLHNITKAKLIFLLSEHNLDDIWWFRDIVDTFDNLEYQVWLDRYLPSEFFDKVVNTLIEFFKTVKRVYNKSLYPLWVKSTKEWDLFRRNAYLCILDCNGQVKTCGMGLHQFSKSMKDFTFDDLAQNQFCRTCPLTNKRKPLASLLINQVLPILSERLSYENKSK